MINMSNISLDMSKMNESFDTIREEVNSEHYLGTLDNLGSLGRASRESGEYPDDSRSVDSNESLVRCIY